MKRRYTQVVHDRLIRASGYAARAPTKMVKINAPAKTIVELSNPCV